MREKLIEILESAESAFYWDSSDKGFIEKIAEHLVANGVRIPVRCKDCKWYQIRQWDDNEPKYDCRKTHALLDVKPDDFCSYGERKDNE